MIENERVAFTKEMKETHTILIPNMLPIHFRLIEYILKLEGFKVEILNTMSSSIIETGLKYVNNDTCYPAQLTIGQLLDATLRLGYDTHKIALLLPQTGGGCRASNYVSLLRKALKKANIDYIPVLSFNLLGMEEHPGFKLSKSFFKKAIYCVLYGDLIMNIKNQVLPYAADASSVEQMVDEICTNLEQQISEGKCYSKAGLKKNATFILNKFSSIPMVKSESKKRVGVVGEIYVKFAPLGNNNLEEMLLREGCEVVVPGLMDFVLYTIDAGIEDYKLYGMNLPKATISQGLFSYIVALQNTVIDAYGNYPIFHKPTKFLKTKELSKKAIHEGTKMGEGWLLTGEMIELIESGVDNIVCTQPFGCLPNHIAGRGMLRKIKKMYPNANIVPIDYDASASKVNQENRIKLMLASSLYENHI